MAVPINRFPQLQRSARVRRERDAAALSRLGLLLFCGAILAGGFVLAAQRHFAAVQYGYENEGLRLERERLLEEGRRLSLERERVSTPARLEEAARRLGLRPAVSGQIGWDTQNAETSQGASPARGNPSVSRGWRTN